MAKYRRIPVVVEAFRLGYDPIPEWFTKLVESSNQISLWSPHESTLIIHAEVGLAYAKNGDYILYEPLVGLSVRSEYSFKKRYEEVQNGEATT